jgi:hypothetical protein
MRQTGAMRPTSAHRARRAKWTNCTLFGRTAADAIQRRSGAIIILSTRTNRCAKQTGVTFCALLKARDFGFGTRARVPTNRRRLGDH